MVTTRGALRLPALLVLAALIGAAVPARADGPEPKPPAALANAKELFRRGVLLLEAGDIERALDFFMRSRESLPSSKNTVNAAICLQRLGRYDEALELYEEVVTRFAPELDAEDRASLGPAIAALRKRVATLDVSANVDGMLVVDGRPRGRLPLAGPVRVGKGRHFLRIFRNGYTPFETRFDVAEGERRAIDARLEPLKGVGLLRVEDVARGARSVFVDGVLVGKTPWEDALSAGRHVIVMHDGDSGSAPSAVIVLQGQTTLQRLSAKLLGKHVRVTVEPPSASLAIDGTAVGTGRWEGHLPMGVHEVRLTESGYESKTIRILVNNERPVDRLVRLDVDPDDPRWPKPLMGHLVLSVFGGYAFSGSLRSGAERDAPPVAVTGPFGGVRLGYRFPVGLAAEAAAGYLSLSSTFRREVDDTFTPASAPRNVHYRLLDNLWLRGPFVDAGGSFGGRLAGAMVTARTATGVLVARASDPLSGTAATGGERVSLRVANRNQTLTATPLFALAELGIALPIGRFELGFALAAAFFPLDGPRFDKNQIGVKPDCARDHRGAVGCTPNSDAIAKERAYGPFTVWLPHGTLSLVL